MKYKKLSIKLKKLEKDFYKAINDFKNDKIFSKVDNVYLKQDKKSIYNKWNKIRGIFSKLKYIINSNNNIFYFKINYNSFIIKCYSIVLYYNMTLKLHETFREHEDFIRQFLDEKYSENYSTIARYIYTPGFLYYLNYPSKFLILLESKVDIDLVWMTRKEMNYNIVLNFEYKNIYYYIKYRIDKLIYVLVKFFGTILSHTRFKFSEEGLISKESIEEFYKFSKPGDILLTRQTYVATNIGIPGFWKHMSMYLGTGEYLMENFRNLEFDKLYKDNHYIIESTGDGVKISNFENFIYKVDYLGVFRTTFSENKIKNAIIETSKMINKGYDYLFNYHSDKSFVCSELITKSYLKDSENDEGLTIELQKIGSGLTYPPNEFVKKAYIEKDLEKKEIFPIIFLDSNQKRRISFINSNQELLISFKRSRFSFFLK